MFVGSQQQLKNYDAYLLAHGYTIEQLIYYASDCLLPHFKDYHNVAIMVGPGNNGADGLSLALKLSQDHVKVTIFYIGDLDRFSPGNQHYFQMCEDANLEMILVDDDVITMLSECINDYDVIADSFFGFGLNSAPRGMYKTVIDTINTYYLNEIIAIDIPTGLDCNSGKPYASVLFASQTICLSALKQGFLNPESRMVTGIVKVEELAIDNPFMEAGLYEIYEQMQASKELKDRKFDGYKQSYGVDLIIAGSKQYRGAPILCAKGAAYSGAGIVKLMSDESVIDRLPEILPELIGLNRLEHLSKEDFMGYQAIAIGPGLSLAASSKQLVADVLKNSTAPLVIDADALTILSEHLEYLENQDRAIVLTPHLGEYKRLCHEDTIEDPMMSIQSFAKKYHVIVVLKGPYTMVSDGVNSYRIASGNPAMAVGGMGDTLTGMITAMLGQGYEPLTAVRLAVFIHGMAGDLVARNAYTVMPEKLSENIPSAMYILNNQLQDKR